MLRSESPSLLLFHMTPKITPQRFHHLDALRAFAMLLGLVLHGFMSFIEIPIWPAQDIHQNSEFYTFLLHAIPRISDATFLSD